jgi:hypothetical protein
MTNKRTGNSNDKGNSRSLRDDKQKGNDKDKEEGQRQRGRTKTKGTDKDKDKRRVYVDGLEDQAKDVGDEDGYACCQAEVPGDTVSFALYFEELAAGRASAYGDQSKGECDDGEEEDHGWGGAWKSAFSWDGRGEG